MCLKVSFRKKVSLPALKAGGHFIEYVVVALLPYLPSPNSKNLHEKLVLGLLLCLCHH
jgi:hypothetical protein